MSLVSDHFTIALVVRLIWRGGHLNFELLSRVVWEIPRAICSLCTISLTSNRSFRTERGLMKTTRESSATKYIGFAAYISAQCHSTVTKSSSTWLDESMHHQMVMLLPQLLASHDDDDDDNDPKRKIPLGRCIHGIGGKLLILLSSQYYSYS